MGTDRRSHRLRQGAGLISPSEHPSCGYDPSAGQRLAQGCFGTPGQSLPFAIILIFIILVVCVIVPQYKRRDTWPNPATPAPILAVYQRL
jgi:hypothetical protein